jgi:hypothetical protein
MTTRTRLFMAAAVGVLVIGLGTGFLASYYGMPVMAQFGGNGPAELEYLPQDAQLVAFANVRDVMDSDLRRKLMELRRTRPEIQRDSPGSDNDFFDQAGINIETDVDRVLGSVTTGASEGSERPLVLARGRFDDDLIETLLRQRGGQVEEYGGKRLITHAENGRAMALAFVEPDLVAFGSADSVRRAIDTKAGRAPNVTGNQEVMNLIRDMDSGNAWAVGRFDAISSRARLPQDIASQLPPINWFAATGHVNGGIEGLIRAETRDEAAAQDLRQVVQGFLALGRLQSGRNAQLRSMVNSLQLGGSGKTVSLSFALPSDVIDALAALQQQQRRDPSQPPAPPAPVPGRDAAPAVPRT